MNPDPRKIEELGDLVDEKVFISSMNFLSGWKDLVELMHKFYGIGATHLVLPSGPDKKKIGDLSKEIFPQFKAV
jgi:hypothetical protein